MCGIVGLHNKIFNYPVINDILPMQSALRHRGPDDENIFSYKNLALAHTRLAIIDKKSGSQPMTFEYQSESYTIVYNGELYNSNEIKEKLTAQNINFFGYSDTEIVLKAYAVYKEKCLDMFNGIFAFAVYEKNSGRIFLARDRMGVKPLFYYNSDSVFCFASEIKGILANKNVPSVIDLSGICQLMLISPGNIPSSGVFKDIYQLEPASYIIYDLNSKKLSAQVKYYKIQATEYNDSVDETIEKTRYLLLDSIKRQMVSDVPIGTFLSGGIDSSIISSVVCEELKKQGKELICFSLDFKDNDIYFKENFYQPSRDNDYILRMQQYLMCKNKWFVPDQIQLVDSLEDAMIARDLPSMGDIDSSMLLLCNGISKYVRVALSGECADEIFGGYPWYKNINKYDFKTFPWSDCAEYRKQFIRSDIAELINEKEYTEKIISDSLADISTLETDSEYDIKSRKMFYMNYIWFMQNLLERKDRMSMASSLEVRVPFCDYRLVEYLYSVPMKIKNLYGYEKGLLRCAMKDYAPQEVLWRKKSPYPKTYSPLYREKLTLILRDILYNKSGKLFDIVEYDMVEKLVNEENEVMWYGQLMKREQVMAYLIQMDLWLKKYKISLM
jgi:asparagine synthase (glutamine-hydrolysing)